MTNLSARVKLGVLVTSIDVFSQSAKDQSEHAARQLFDELVKAGSIDPGSLILGRIGNPHEALQAADQFASAGVDLVVLLNVAFPNGQVFLTLATHPRLARIPLAVVAEPEARSGDWSTNAWCGVIMNNFVARQISRPVVALAGSLASREFRSKFDCLLRAAGAIRALRRDFLGRLGDAPGGFHSATGDQVAFAAMFGTRVDTVDLTAVLEVYRTGQARGYLGEVKFSDADVQATVEELSRDRKVEVERPMLERGARLYQALRAVIRANGYTSISLRCWPEFNEPFIGIGTCLATGLLLGKGDVTASGCEGDWPTAVAQSLGALLTGRPAACFDWVNDVGAAEVVQLGHCGAGICGQMACGRDIISHHPVLRHVGKTAGPVHVGQFQHGPKTGLCLLHEASGKFKLLVFRGESGPDTDLGMDYSAADVRVKNPRRLHRLILDHGFPHHLALAFGDVSEEARMVCQFLGVEFVSPDAEEEGL